MIAAADPSRAVGAARIPALPPVAGTGRSCPLPRAFRPAFVRASRETRLPLGLLVAVATVESRFDPDARSAAGARGVMQVMPATAASLELDAGRPETNVLAGARYLRILLEQFGSPDLALAAYNAGPTAVAAAGGPPFAETEAYVSRVNAVWRSLAGCG